MRWRKRKKRERGRGGERAETTKKNKEVWWNKEAEKNEEKARKRETKSCGRIILEQKRRARAAGAGLRRITAGVGLGARARLPPGAGLLEHKSNNRKGRGFNTQRELQR